MPALPDDLSIQGTVQVGSNYIDFGTLGGTSYVPAPGSGNYQTTSVAPGSLFATNGVTATEAGMIQSLNEPPGSVMLPGAFMTFLVGGSNLQLWATSIPAGAVGPLTLTDTAQGAEAAFQVDGYIWDTASSSQIGTFSSEFVAGFPGMTVANLFGNLPEDTNYCGSIEVGATTPSMCDPFSAATAPEPSQGLLLGAGLLGLAVVGRAFRKRLA